MTQPSRLVTGILFALLLSVSSTSARDTRSEFSMLWPSVTGNYLAGQQALQDLRTADAASFFRQAAEEDWDNPLLIDRAVTAYAANGQIEDAAASARHLAELGAATDIGNLTIGAEALKQRRYAAAIKQLQPLGDDSYAGIAVGILRAWAYAGNNQLDEANKALDTIGQGRLEDFLVFHRALMADVAGRSQQALDLVAKAYEASPNVARVVEAYARMLGNAGRFDEAGKVIAGFENQGLNNPMIDVVKAAVQKRQRPGIFAANVQSGAAEMFHTIGVAVAREVGAEYAAIFLQIGMYLDPNADVLDMMLGQLLDNADQHEAANAIYEALSAKSPMKPMAIVRMAQNLDVLGDREEAIRQLASIAAANPQDIEALSALGDLQRNDERYADAAATYSQALQAAGGDKPGNWRFYYVRGISYERNKEWPKAEVDFQQALKLNPDQPQVLNYLGYSWVDQGINLMPALDMINKAVAAAPNDGYIVDSLGWAYYRLGRMEEAVVTLETAVQLRPSDPEINDHLGDAYWRVGRKLEARFQWNVAASVDKEGRVKERVAKKLAEGLDALAPPPAPGISAENTAPAKP